MDFKSLMAAQIAKAKPSSGNSGTSTTTTTTSSSKYLRRAELEAERQAQYEAEQAQIEIERLERASKKRKIEEEEAEKKVIREEKLRKFAEESRIRREALEREEEQKRRKRLGLPDLPDPNDDDDLSKDEDEATNIQNQEDIEDESLRSKLRSLNQPAVLFDENHSSRLSRYYKIIHKPKKQQQLSNTPIPTTISMVNESEIPLLSTSTLPNKDSPEYVEIFIHLASYFTLILTEWSKALSKREEHVKNSITGIKALQTYNLVIKDLTPLFRKFEKSISYYQSQQSKSKSQNQIKSKPQPENNEILEEDLLKAIIKIVFYSQKREYVKANDEYLKLSIGKAAWPIGVTMVGIHERSAREKLHENGSGGDGKKAHILSDEITRKLLQSIKRCLSFNQTRWPPYDGGQLMG